MFVLWRSLRLLVDSRRADGSSTGAFSQNPVMSSPVSALSDRPLVGQVAPPNSHRPLAVSGSIFEPCRFVALLVDSARGLWSTSGPLWNAAGRGRLLAGERRLTPVRGALYEPSPTLARRQGY